jgi:hypothetical protein
VNLDELRGDRPELAHRWLVPSRACLRWIEAAARAMAAIWMAATVVISAGIEVS